VAPCRKLSDNLSMPYTNSFSCVCILVVLLLKLTDYYYYYYYYYCCGYLGQCWIIDSYGLVDEEVGIKEGMLYPSA